MSYLGETGPEYYAFQKSWCHNWAGDNWMDKRLVYTGGMDAVKIGAIITMWENMDYEFTEGDASRFDGHTELEAMEAEIESYEREGLPARSLRWLKTQLLEKMGKTATGVKYTYTGKFDSGLINTSGGNTRRMFMMLAGFFDSIGLTDYRIMALGDDNIIATKGKWNMSDLKQCAETAATT
jgi:hypothetical protein